MSGNVKVVKIRPYPISTLAFLREGAPPTRCQILRLTRAGFILRYPPSVFFRAAMEVLIEFDIPATHESLKTKVLVIKIYDRALEDSKREHLAEMHFISIPENAQQAIDYFLNKIGQKK